MKPLFPRPLAGAILLLGIFGWVAAVTVAELMEPEGFLSDFLGPFLGFVATPALLIGLVGFFVGHGKDTA